MRRHLTKLLLPLVINLACAGQGHAENYYLEHWWKSKTGETEHFGLNLSEARVRQAMTAGRDMYGHEQLRQTILNNAKLLSQRISSQDVQINLRTFGNSYEISYTYREGSEEKARQLKEQVKDYIDNGFENLSSQTYYRYDKDLKELVINYQDIVLDYADVITATHQFFKQRDPGKTQSQMINDRLNFLQSIPYDDLLQNDFGMLPPIRMLAENRGDCESKQVYMAGLLKLLYPNRAVYLVLLPEREHIVAAVEIPEVPDNLVYLKNGKRFLIVDATGPSYADVADSIQLRNKWNFDYGRQLWYPIGFR